QFADARLSDRGEVNHEQFARPGVTNVPEDSVAFVPRIPFDITLRGEALLPLHLNGEVNVRGRATGVRDRLDGAEGVLAGRAGQAAPEPLEVRVPPAVVIASGVEVGGVVIHLPDFHDRVPDRFAVPVEDPAAQVSDLPDGGGDRIIDDEQIVVSV